MGSDCHRHRYFVNDPDGPVIGATVQVKGTTIATATDFDGNLTLGSKSRKAV